MKNAFSVNVTTNETESNKFRVRKLSDELARIKERSDETVQNIKRTSSIPRWLDWAATIIGGLGFIVIMAFLDAAIETDFASVYDRAGWFVYAGGAGLLIGLSILLYKAYRVKTVYNSPAVRAALTEKERLNSRCYEDLGVPQDSEAIDVFCEAVKEKNGKVKKAGSLYQFTNVSFKIFRDADNLYLADLDGVYAFPVSGFFEILTVKKTALFYGWNKDEPFNKLPYRRYKIRRNNYGVFFIKPHYFVKLIAFNEEYSIVIPSYELETLQKYLTLSIV